MSQINDIVDDYIVASRPATHLASLSTGDSLDLPVEFIAEQHRQRYPGAFSSDEPTPYEKSELSDSKIELDRQQDPNGLFGRRQPHYAIKHERYEHRIVVYLKAEGKSNKEIAELTGMTTVAVSNIVRQPWAEQEILRLIRESGAPAVQAMIQGAAVDAVQRLITEMDNEAAKPSERISASRELLDRAFGKAPQSIDHKITNNLASASDSELEALIASCKRG